MSSFASRPDISLNQWLADQHRHMVIDLAATLDLKAGLREVMIPALHANLVADLGDVLDVEAGLSAIVPTAPDPTPHVPEPTASLDIMDAELLAAKGRFETDPKQASPDPMSLTDLEELVRAAASCSPSTRLAMRNHPAFALARDLYLYLDRDRTRTRTRDLALALDHYLALDLDHYLALDLDYYLGRDLALDLPLDLPLAVALAVAFAVARALARALGLALGLVRDLVRDLALGLALDRGLDRGLALDRAHALARNLDRTTVVVADLHHALNDFTGVDLRSVDLDGIPLVGLRWSMATQWPPQWAEQVRRDSVQVGDGIFEIRGGRRYAPTTV